MEGSDEGEADGALEGELEGGAEGTLEGTNADFEGRFSGKLRLSGVLSLKSTAFIEGEVEVGFLLIRVALGGASPPRADCGSVLHDLLALVEGLVAADFRELCTCSGCRYVEGFVDSFRQVVKLLSGDETFARSFSQETAHLLFCHLLDLVVILFWRNISHDLVD